MSSLLGEYNRLFLVPHDNPRLGSVCFFEFVEPNWVGARVNTRGRAR